MTVSAKIKHGHIGNKIIYSKVIHEPRKVEWAALEEYRQQQFADLPVSQENHLYRLTDKLEILPQVPEGRRLMLLNEKMEVVYDSQNPKEYKAIEKGFISFI